MTEPNLVLDLAVRRGLLSPEQAARNSDARSAADLVARGLLDETEARVLESLLRKLEEDRAVLDRLVTEGEITRQAADTARTFQVCSREYRDVRQALDATRAPERMGRYEILEELGRGGMGTVYKARDPELMRTVAVKVMRPSGLPDDHARFLREARAVAALRHPGIVPVHDIGEHAGQSYFVMELIEGTSLDRAKLDECETVEILRQAAEAVAHAHEKGILHRDLKPQNILVTPDRRAMVLDFGLARVFEAGGSGLSVPGVPFGTPAYMPPEQALGKWDEVDARSDVYSLGATLYAVLAGVPPFEGASISAVLQKVVSETPRPIREIRPGLDPRVEEACRRAMEKDRAKRHASAREFAAALEVSPGRTFRGLEILGTIARGGMGIVHRARQASLDRTVALKLLLPELAAGPSFQSRFEREAKVLASLTHPRIVAVHDSGKEGGTYFLLMEFVDGPSLRDRIRARNLTTADAVRVASQVCEGLAFAHGLGIVHRDIKPENLLLDKGGDVKIADFGLAKLVDREAGEHLTQEGAAVGTFRYMAPEQIDAPDRVDARTDLYSTGVVLYEMLRGTLPVGKFAPASDDPPLASIVARALDTDPSRRFQSADEMRQALQSWRPARAPVRWGRPAAAAVAILALLAFFLVPSAQRPRIDWTPYAVHDPFLALLPEAASIDANDWSAMLRPPNLRRSDSLTAVLLAQPPGGDVEFTHSTIGELRSAIERPGAITILQPEYLRVTFEESSGRGACAFESAVFRGRVEFSAVREAGRWRISEIRCPKGGEVLTRRIDGWKLAAPARSGVRAALPGALEAPSGAPLVRKPRWTPDDLGIRMEGVRSGCALGWTETDLVVVDCENPTAAERSLSSKRGHWTHISGSILVAAFAGQDRSQFLDLVHRTQRRLGLPFEAPPLPFAEATLAYSPQLSSDPEMPGVRLPTTSVESVLASPRAIPGVEARDVAQVYASLVEGPLRLTAWEFRSVAVAARAERRIRSEPPWARIRRIEVLRVRNILTVVLADSDSDPATELLRKRMGFSPLSLESVLPSKDDLPEGARIASRTEDVAEAARSLGVELSCDRAASLRLDPPATVAVLDRPVPKLPALTFGGWTCVVRADNPSYADDLLLALAGKLGIPVTPPRTAWTSIAIRAHQGKVAAVAFHPEGACVASGGDDTVVRTWNLDGSALRTLTPPLSGQVFGVAFFPGGKKMASVSSDAHVRQWDLESGTETGSFRIRERALCLAISPSGEKIVTGGYDFWIRIFRTDGTEPLRFPQEGSYVLSVAFRPDGRIFASAAWDRKIKLWDPETGEEKFTWRGHESTTRIHQIAWRPDASILASAGADRTVRLWNPNTGESVRTLTDFGNEVRTLAFSPDGKFLATGCLDGQLRIWVVETGKLAHRLTAHEKGVYSLAYSPDGRKIVTGGGDGLVRIWSLE